MLTINNLNASIDGKAILKGIALVVKPGEAHAVMGPTDPSTSNLAPVYPGNS